MPRSIASQRVGRRRVAGKSIGARHGLTNLQSPYQFPPGTHSFVVPKSGYWKFAAWSAGETGTTYGASGGYGEITKALLAGQVVAVVASIATAGAGNTTLTFPDGAAPSITPGSAGVGGVATGFDVNLSGTNNASPGNPGLGTGGGLGGGLNGGAGAPANLPFKGGTGGGDGSGNAQLAGGRAPGGGCGNSPGASGGDGQVLAYLVRE